MLAYRQLVHARPENGPEHLYERLLPYLNSRPLLSNVPAGLSQDAEIVFRAPPRGGNPSKARTIWEATRHCLHLMGLKKPQAKRTAVHLRWTMLRMAEGELPPAGAAMLR
ncbi:unnamed protein product, partial [Ectocarpus sp. 12 AP-2014]